MYDKPEYQKAEINHIKDLREQAIKFGDVPKDTFLSAFMMLYFRYDGNTAFDKYWSGERHMPTWLELKNRKELSDKLK